MAFAKARTGSSLAPVRSRGAVVSKARYEALQERSRAVGKRLRQAADEDGDALLSVGAGVALALYEKGTAASGPRQLPTIMGLDSAITIGTVGYLITRKAKSKTARMIRTASIGLATVGANRSAMRGSMKVAGDDSPDDDDESDI